MRRSFSTFFLQVLEVDCESEFLILQAESAIFSVYIPFQLFHFNGGPQSLLSKIIPAKRGGSHALILAGRVENVKCCLAVASMPLSDWEQASGSSKVVLSGRGREGHPASACCVRLLRPPSTKALVLSGALSAHDGIPV